MPENRITSSKSATYRDPFKPATPQRRKTGSRAKLAKRFFEDVYAAWEEQGESVIARAFFHDPVASMQMVARLMPQKIEISTPTDGMSDERLAELIDHYEQLAGLKADAARVIQGQAIEGGAAAALPAPAQSAAPPASLCSHKLADENGDLRNADEAGGGGPQQRMGGGGENTLRAIEAERAKSAGSPQQHNTLEQAKMPYPVGRPFPEPDHSVSARNRARLAEPSEPIDPASLF